MTENIYWILKATIKQGQIEALKKLTAEFVELTQKNEPATIGYEWSIDAEANTLCIYERFENSDAALVHLGNVGEKLPELMALIDLIGFDCYGSASDAFKEAVKEMPFTFFDTYNGFHR